MSNEQLPAEITGLVDSWVAVNGAPSDHESLQVTVHVPFEQGSLPAVSAIVGGVRSLLNARETSSADEVHEADRGRDTALLEQDAQPAALTEASDKALTIREHTVVELMTRGLSDREIASRLQIPLSAVQRRLQSAGEKFGLEIDGTKQSNARAALVAEVWDSLNIGSDRGGSSEVVAEDLVPRVPCVRLTVKIPFEGGYLPTVGTLLNTVQALGTASLAGEARLVDIAISSPPEADQGPARSISADLIDYLELTRYEVQLIELIARGDSDAEIASQMPRAEKMQASDITRGINRLCKLVGVRNRMALVSVAYGIISHPTESEILETEPSVVASTVDTSSASAQQHRRQIAETFNLSEKEVEVLDELATGKDIEAVAQALGISHHTVKTHLRRTKTKLKVPPDAKGKRSNVALIAVYNGSVGFQHP